MTVLQLPTLVSVAFDECDPTFSRYSQSGDGDFLGRVFRRIAYIDLGVPLNVNDYGTVLQGRIRLEQN